MDSQEEHRHHEIEYFVNGERQETKERKLRALTILERAGLTPPADYRLERDHDHKKYKSNEEVEIHDKERFTATYIGPVPTS